MGIAKRIEKTHKVHVRMVHATVILELALLGTCMSLFLVKACLLGERMGGGHDVTPASSVSGTQHARDMPNGPSQ